MTIEDFKVGDRVELHPGLDAWMRGARFGQVEKVGRKLVHVRLDRTRIVIGIRPGRLTLAEQVLSRRV